MGSFWLAGVGQRLASNLKSRLGRLKFPCCELRCVSMGPLPAMGWPYSLRRMAATNKSLARTNKSYLWRERTNLRTRSERPSGVGPPVVVAPPPTDAQVIAGTILGIAGMAINASMYRRDW